MVKFINIGNCPKFSDAFECYQAVYTFRASFTNTHMTGGV